jgi:CBS domain-containing protein
MRRLQKTIQEIGWSREVPRLVGSDPVTKAIAAMSPESHHCVLVMDGDALAGIFTGRDFLDRVAAEREDPALLTLSSVMTPAPRTLRPHDPVAYAINWMALDRFRNVPIVDDLGHVLGVLTVWDVMRHLNEFFDEIDATPRLRMPQSDTSRVVSMIDIGGGE